MSLAELDRRDVLRGAGALTLGLQFAAFAGRAAGQPAAPTALTAWVRITPDDRVTLILSQAEIGQGISTTLPAILADELGADWSRIVVENAPVAQKDISPYQNPRIHFMFTGNSESIASFSTLMRQTGAAAREMLIAAAVKRWRGAKAADCTTASGKVIHRPTRRSLSFGALAADAAQLPVPEKPALRPTAELRLTGRAVPRRDIPAKTDGSAVFGLDFRVAGMAYAAVRQAPAFGGAVAQFDPASVAKRPGVIGAFAIPNGVAVVAEHFWQAKTAVDALAVTFAPGPNAAVSTASIAAQYRAALDGASWGTISNQGDAAGATAAAARKFEAEYWSPFQAHATMEPMNCTASVTADGCDIWAPTQGPELTRIVAGAITKLPPENIRVHWTYAGGGFGRRLLADFVAQALVLSKAVQRPVKVVWTREEDMTHDFYRPATLTRITAALDPDGKPTAIAARLVSATQLAPVSPAPLPANVDPRCTEGLEETRYAIANFRLDYNKPALAVPTSVLRTTGFGPNIFAIESFIDELAHVAGADPYRSSRTAAARPTRPEGARSRGREIRLGNAACKGRGPRHRVLRGVRHRDDAGGRARGGRQGRAGAPHRHRGRSRPRVRSRHRGLEPAGRRRVGPHQRDEERDHLRQGRRHPGEFRRLRRGASVGGAGRQRGASPRKRRRQDRRDWARSARPAFRRPSPTRSSPPPASGCARCRCHATAIPSHKTDKSRRPS